MLNNVKQIANGKVHNYLFKRYTSFGFEALILLFIPNIHLHDVLYLGHIFQR